MKAATAATVAALLVAANLLAFWHQATVAHARCADHGELVHVGGGASDASVLSAGALLAADRADLDDGGVGSHLRGRSWAAGEEHDHCQLCPVTRATAAVERPPTITRAAVAALVIESTPPDAPAPAIAVVTLAPKTSPPV